jgi:subtilase family serine protease
MTFDFRRNSMLGLFLFLLTVLTFSGDAQTLSAHPLEIQGTVHPSVWTAQDRGAMVPTTQLNGIQLYLLPSSAQRMALSQLLQDQQNPQSPQYHQRLTPVQFGQLFGVSQQDETLLRNWLTSQGFHDITISNSRNVITFSGNVQQAGAAFSTEIHAFNSQNEAHYANVSNIKLPAAIAGLVQSVRGLDDFRPKSHAQKVAPRFTDSNGQHYIAPGDIATMYDMQSLYAAGIDGTGVTAAVVGQTDINLSDIAAYRSGFGLPANAPSVVLATTSTDPGVITGDLTEADLDIEILGAVARNAKIVYVNSNNVYTSLQFAIDQNLAQLISMSYGSCESNTPAYFQSLELLGEQANAEGITLLAASGDSGAADCEAANTTMAQYGLTVDSPASTPEFTGVGGTDFISTSSYFSSSNGSQGGSAVSYIPEMAWNNTAAYGVLTASGGGVSSVFSKPAWQSFQGVPGDGFRDVPDVAFYSMSAASGYVVCTAGNCTNGIPNPVVNGDIYGGTSAATPLFAGIVALLNNYLVTNGQIPAPGLGNINPHLYLLANTTTGVFHDVTQGNNIVPCKANTTGCTSGSYGYSAATGYDQVTGLGSVDTFTFLKEWDTANITGTTIALTDSSSSVVDGSSVTLTALVTAAAGNTLPTGTVTFYSNQSELGSATLDQTGHASLTVATLTAGNNSVLASYSGSVTLGQSLSKAATVNVLLPTQTTLTSSSTQTSQGQTVVLTATVAGANQVATGSVTFYNGTSSLGSVALSSGSASLQLNSLPVGSDAITAVYSGSSTFATSTSTVVTVAVSSTTPSATATTTTLTASPTSGPVGSTVTLAAIVTQASGNTVPTGTVTFYNGTTTLGTATLSSGTASLQVTTLPLGTNSVTASYMGSASFAKSTSATISVAIAQAAAPDFTMAASVTSLNVTGGQTAAANLTITPENGFNQTLVMQCSGLPSGASCAFGTPVLQANGSSTVAVTISTVTLTAFDRHLAAATTLCTMIPFFGLFSSRRRKAFAKVLTAAAMLCLLVLPAGLLTGCGGASKSAAGTTPATPSPQTSTITITAASQGGTAVSHTVQIALTVD